MRQLSAASALLLLLVASCAAPAADPSERFSPVDLRQACNRGLGFDTPQRPASDGVGWTGMGEEDLSALPVGRFVFNHVPFDIIDAAQNQGRSAILLHGRHMPDNPKRVTIPVGRAFRRLHVLHTGIWCTDRPGYYRIVFRGGRSQTVELIKLFNISDWYAPQDMPAALLAWYGARRKGGGGLGLFLCTIELERRTPIDHLELVSSGTDGVIAVIAITGER